MYNILTAAPGAEETAAQITFQPANCVENLQHMGIGMLGVFMIIGIIMLATYVIGKLTAPKQNKQQ